MYSKETRSVYINKCRRRVLASYQWHSRSPNMTAVPESHRPLRVTVGNFPSEDPVSKARGIRPALALGIVTLLPGPGIEVQDSVHRTIALLSTFVQHQA